MAKLLTCIDLFCGAGGLSYGLEQEGFRVAGAVEIDKVSARSYKLNHEATKVIVDDIRRVRGPEILRQSGLANGVLDLLTGCPPCQAFSTLQTRRAQIKPEKKSKYLAMEMLRLIRSAKPRAVILENVPGLSKDVIFSDFCQGLIQSGYQYTFSILNASDYGVPQRRLRLILVALKGRKISIDWQSLKEKPCTVRSAIGNLFPAGTSGDPLHDMPENRSAAMLTRIKATPKNGGSRCDIPPELQCACHGRVDGFRDVYGRMTWDDVAPTITSGCNNPSKGRFLHPEENRAITLREAALLQSFPQSYQFCLDRGKEHVASQVGNAFPPNMIRPIAKVIRNELET
jgi:DNA (cytosine-5)-methyltransferase 1